MDLVRAVTELDQSTDLHLARILILLNAFAQGSSGGPIEGLTKLAKLDFLVRYPMMLQKALEVRGRSTNDVRLEPHERYSVESQMVRYRFGPWDHRYREFLNLLVAKGLATVSVEGRKVVVSITDTGASLASQLSSTPVFELHASRASALKRHLDQEWGFWDTGSGGKKTLFNVCYALALHRVGIERGLPVPNVLVIDSPTKNISDDENPELIRSLYDEIYKLAIELEVQFLLIDSDLVEPATQIETFVERRMAGEPGAPSLISYYSGP